MKTSNKRYFSEAEAMMNDKFLNLDGFADDEFENFDDELLNADASPAEKAVTSQPYIIQVTNSSTADISNVVVCGANQNLAPNVTNFGNSSSVSISMGTSGVTYAQFLAQTQTQPFTVGLTYLQSSNTSQVLATLSLTTFDANGNSATKVLTPTLDPYQYLNTVLPIKQLYTIDGNKEITIATLYASATLNIHLYPTEKINIKRGLANLSVDQSYGNPDIIKKQKVVIAGSAMKALG